MKCSTRKMNLRSLQLNLRNRKMKLRTRIFDLRSRQMILRSRKLKCRTLKKIFSHYRKLNSLILSDLCSVAVFNRINMKFRVTNC
jgi:hypothetical protein